MKVAKKYLPPEKSQDETFLVQADLPVELAKFLKEYKEPKGYSWNDVVIAALKMFRDEIKDEKKRS